MNREQIKKHISQMSEQEEQHLVQACKQCAKKAITFTNHARRRHIRFQERDVRHCLRQVGRHSTLIEYNEVWSDGICLDKRVLLRQTHVYYQTKKKEVHVCFVFSLFENQVITMYTNDVKDNHATLDWRNYTSDLLIIK